MISLKTKSRVKSLRFISIQDERGLDIDSIMSFVKCDIIFPRWSSGLRRGDLYFHRRYSPVYERFFYTEPFVMLNVVGLKYSNSVRPLSKILL